MGIGLAVTSDPDLPVGSAALTGSWDFGRIQLPVFYSIVTIPLF